MKLVLVSNMWMTLFVCILLHDVTTCVMKCLSLFAISLCPSPLHRSTVKWTGQSMPVRGYITREQAYSGNEIGFPFGRATVVNISR